MSAVAVGVGVAAVGVGVSAAQAAGAFSPGSGPSATETTIQGKMAQLYSMPTEYKYNAVFNPKYAALNRTIADQNLFAKSGTLDLAERAQPRLLGLQTADRAHTLADVQRFSPEVLQAIKDYNPQAYALLTGANEQVQQRLDSRGQLDPFTRMALQQNYRGAEAARGLAGGAGDAAMEAYYQTATQEQRQLQNLALADQQVGVNQSFYGDPFARIAGLTTGTGTNGAASYTASQPNAYGGVDPGAYGLAQSAGNRQYEADVAAYNSQMSGIGSLVSNVPKALTMASGYFGSGNSAQNGVPYVNGSPYGLGGMAG